MSTHHPWKEWTEARVELLKQLSRKGLSASQIALQINQDTKSDFSRSSIISKLRRLGTSTARATNRKMKPVTVQEEEELESKTPSLRGMSAYDKAIPEEQRKTILELTATTCRWPVGDPRDAGFFYCGGQTNEKLYCPAHEKVAHRHQDYDKTKKSYR